MKIPPEEMTLLGELLRGRFPVANLKPGTVQMSVAMSLFNKGWAERDERANITITDIGREAFAAEANRASDAEDATADAMPDPGPLLRIVTHLKESVMSAYRLGYNEAKAKHQKLPTTYFSKDSLRALLKRAFVNTKISWSSSISEDEAIDILLLFLVNQVEHGTIAGNK